MAQQITGDGAIGGERAVSPVLGVAILVGITVVLGAVVGVFVFDIVESGPNAPDATIELGQDSQNFTTNETDSSTGIDRRTDDVLSVVEINHNGGDRVDNERLTVQVTGNRTSGIENNRSVFDVDYNGDGDHDEWNTTVPEGGHFTIGEEYRVVFYGVSEAQIEGKRIVTYNHSPNLLKLDVTSDSDFDSGNEALGRKLESGDEIEVIWRTPGSREGQRLVPKFEVA
jgi:flagellin-like protein